jgi:translation elongation factor EF-4
MSVYALSRADHTKYLLLDIIIIYRKELVTVGDTIEIFADWNFNKTVTIPIAGFDKKAPVLFTSLCFPITAIQCQPLPVTNSRTWIRCSDEQTAVILSAMTELLY